LVCLGLFKKSEQERKKGKEKDNGGLTQGGDAREKQERTGKAQRRYPNAYRGGINGKNRSRKIEGRRTPW